MMLFFSQCDREYLEDFIDIAKKEMERPINFLLASLPRRFLKIPCDVEVGENYKDLVKYQVSYYGRGRAT